MHTNSKGKAVLTGASSGIGAIAAGRLAERGLDLILVDTSITALVNNAGVGAPTRSLMPMLIGLRR